jgi:hypothetical protein
MQGGGAYAAAEEADQVFYHDVHGEDQRDY